MTEAGSFNPRNPWHHVAEALSLGRQGDAAQGRHVLAGLRYHGGISAEDLSRFDALLAAQQQQSLPIRGPSDLMENPEGYWRVPFRVLDTGQEAPKPYPPGLALPQLLAKRHDVWPLHQAAAAVAAVRPAPDWRVLLFYAVEDLGSCQHFLHDLAAQQGPGKLQLLLCTSQHVEAVSALLSQFDFEAEIVPAAFLSPQAQSRCAAHLRETQADCIGVLSGAIRLDPGFLQRVVHVNRVSDRVVQPLQPVPSVTPALTPYAVKTAQETLWPHYQHHHVATLNMMVPTALLRHVGLLNTGFTDLGLAARELAFRCCNEGAYLAPVLVPELPLRCDIAAAQDWELLRRRCPDLERFEQAGTGYIPKVSVYIPTYNASKYIAQAVDSVLEQDVEDLEVCLANDGSTDHTLEILQRCFGDDPRVRVISHRNGGIGYASNQAISMARGIYIGQLDSDDRLRPGAVRRMMEYLDEHPDVACCYGSCERVDAQGQYLQEEYSWTHFSRQKMMITSIAHHFRMFRRANWARTSQFRHDIRNAVDYDIFLKLAETGRFHHIEETLYQRRWHGENTSNVNEDFQTANTYRVQREALKRQGLNRYWDVYVADPNEPRRVGYRRIVKTPRVMFWPNYARANPYQSLLYRSALKTHEIVAAPIEEAVRALEIAPEASPAIFHLHWTNFLFVGVTDRGSARLAVRAFLKSLIRFKELGGRIIWTIHNTLSHDNPFVDLERSLSERIVKLADVVHFHSAASISEVRAIFDIPSHKIRISRHGHYLGVYADYISRETARATLGIEEDEEVILFLGQVRPYKGVGQLVQSFRQILKNNPRARLVIGGAIHDAFWNTVEPALNMQERARILASERFLDETEMQVFLRAADLAVFPYRNILTSGSLLLALSFGLPVVIPEVGMTREVLKGSDAGVLYDRADPDGLLRALNSLLAKLREGQELQSAALAVAQGQGWPNVAETLFAEFA